MTLQALFISVVLMATPAFAADHLVKMKSISFEPKLLEIKVGDTVEWSNVSYTEHSATSVAPDEARSGATVGNAKGAAFDTGLVQPKAKSKKIEFRQAGEFLYICSVHGKTMSGRVVVSDK